MRYVVCILVSVGLGIALDGSNAAGSTYSIPADKIDVQKVYLGSATGFEKAAKVDYESVIKATPEYSEVRKKKIEPGTGKYWILMSQASERAVRAISDVGKETGYDFIAAQAYLGNLEPTIPSEDITPLVMDKVKDTPRDREKDREEVKTKKK